MRRSSQDYDSGFAAEAKRLAVSIRVLLHDTAGSRSLLGLLDVKTKMTYLDTGGGVDPSNLLSTNSLCMMRVTSTGGEWVPRLGDGPPIPGVGMHGKRLPFDQWWEMHVVKDQRGALFSRKELVLKVSNKDGGAHVDADLPSEYAELSRGNSLGWSLVRQGEPEQAIGRDPVMPSVRQIAFELEKSLEEHAHLIR